MIYPYHNPISNQTELWTVTYTLTPYFLHRIPPGGEIEDLHVYGPNGIEITDLLPTDTINDIYNACYDD